MKSSLVRGQISANSDLRFQPGLSTGPEEFLLSVSPTDIRSMRDGKFGVRLDPGDYQVSINGVLEYRITVPVGGTEHEFQEIIKEVYQKPVTTSSGSGGLSLLTMVLDLWRRASEWLLKSGGVMSGPLILSEHPTSGGDPKQAATRGYVDSRIVETARHVHTQAVPAVEWVVLHELNGFPSATITDPEGRVIGGEVQYMSTSEVRVRFNSPEPGYLYL